MWRGLSSMGCFPTHMTWGRLEARSSHSTFGIAEKGLELGKTGIWNGETIGEHTQIIHLFIGFSIINHPFWGIPIFGNTHMRIQRKNNSPKARDGPLASQHVAKVKSEAFYKKKTASLRAKNEVRNLEENSWSWIRWCGDCVGFWKYTVCIVLPTHTYIYIIYIYIYLFIYLYISYKRIMYCI